MRKAIIVNDHPFVLATVRMLVINAGFEVVSDCDNGVDAVQQCEHHKPDLMVLDLAIPGLDGLEVICQLKEYKNQCNIVVRTSQSSEHLTLRCLQAGAVGYVSKKDNLSMLCETINAVMSGYSLFPQLSQDNREKGATTEIAQRLARLSNRERAAMKHLVNGMGNKQIAEVLSLSEKTISTYKTRLYGKMDVSSLMALPQITQYFEIE